MAAGTLNWEPRSYLVFHVFDTEIVFTFHVKQGGWGELLPVGSSVCPHGFSVALALSFPACLSPEKIIVAFWHPRSHRLLEAASVRKEAG